MTSVTKTQDAIHNAIINLMTREQTHTQWNNMWALGVERRRCVWNECKSPGSTTCINCFAPPTRTNRTWSAAGTFNVRSVHLWTAASLCNRIQYIIGATWIMRSDYCVNNPSDARGWGMLWGWLIIIIVAVISAGQDCGADWTDVIRLEWLIHLPCVPHSDGTIGVQIL